MQRLRKCNARRRGLVLVALVVAGTPLLMSNTASSETVPGTLATNCQSDDTAALNAWFATAPRGSVLTFPKNACYLVSNSTSSYLTIANKSDLTLDANGSIFKQAEYDCGSNTLQPIIQLTGDTDLTFNGLTIDGPADSCGGGASNEGDYGVLLGQATPGNSNIKFNHDTIEDTNGDAFAVYPQLGTCCGINTNVTFENGLIQAIGGWAFTPEGVNGLHITNNTLNDAPGFMDMEVDANADPDNTDIPPGVGQWNINVADNLFTNGSQLGFWSNQGICVPQKNLQIVGNTVDSTGAGMEMELGGSGSTSCDSRDSGLTIAKNDVESTASSTCGGGGGVGCAMIEIADYQLVLITGNHFDADDSNSNTPWVPCISLQGTNATTIENNTCEDAYNVWSSGYWQFGPSTYGGPVNTKECGNTYWLTNPVENAPVDALADDACSLIIPRATNG